MPDPADVHAQAASEAPILTIYAAGDTTGHGMPPESAARTDPLSGIESLLRTPDVFLFNNEGALIDPALAEDLCAPFGRQSVFHTAPGFADPLSLANHNIAVLANNHILDCGASGLATTIESFEARGFATVGAGEDKASACAPQVLEINGLRVAVLAYLAHSAERFTMQEGSAGAATWAGCDGERAVAALADSTDLVLVSLHLHLSRSWTEFAAEEHLALARAVLAAGADIVFGHGPHVPQGAVLAENGVALLSLGNFVFNPGYEMGDMAGRSVMAEIKVMEQSFVIDLLPLRMDKSGWPAPATPGDAERISRDLIGLSARLGTMLGAGERGARLIVPRQTSPEATAGTEP